MKTATFKIAVMTYVLLFATCAANGQDDKKAWESKVRQLVQEIGQYDNLSQIPPTQEEREEKDVQKQAAMTQIRQEKENENKLKRDKAINKLAAMSDEVVDFLDRESRNGHIGGTILILSKINTEKAIKVRDQSIIDATLGRNGFKGESVVAAGRDLRVIQNKSVIKEVLQFAKNKDVKHEAVKAIVGVNVDLDLLSLLQPYLQDSTEYYFSNRWFAAKVLGADPSTVLAKENVIEIVKSLETADQIPRAYEKFQNDWLGTRADITYSKLTKALIETKGADEALRQITDKTQGKTRTCVIIARAQRGETAVKSEIIAIIKDPQIVAMTNMRLLATRSLEKIGGIEDLPFLHQLATEDPLEITDFGGSIFEKVNGQFVNLGEQWSGIQEENSRPSNTFYPIRGAASKAIQEIEQKTKK